MGWAQPSLCEQCLPLFTCYVNSGGWQRRRSRRKKKKGWPAVGSVNGGVAGGDRQRRWWWRWRFAVVGGAVFLSLSLSSILRSYLLLLLFLLFSGFFSFYFAFSLLFSSLSLLFSSLFLSLGFVLFLLFLSSLSPVFIGEKRGRDMARAATVLPPRTAQGVCPLHSSTTWQASGLSASFWEFDVSDRGRKKNLLLPLLHASRGRKRNTVPSKRHHFGAPSSFFFLINRAWNGAVLVKTRRFI